MAVLTAPQFRLSLTLAAIVYVATMAAVVAWLGFNAEQTVQRRMHAFPDATVSLYETKTEVPASWQDPSAENAVDTPAQAMPESEAVAALPPQVAPNEAPAPSAADTATAAPSQEPQGPAVTVDPTATPPVPPLAVWQKNARPFDQKDTRPRIGLVIADLGMAHASTQTAIQDLPGEVSLAFSSLAPDLEQQVSTARVAGHEVILTVPMEPENYPLNDAGPSSLLIGLPDRENINRINRAMARAEGYVAVAPYMGDKFVTAEVKLAPVLDAVKQQQLMVLDGTMNKASLIAPLARYQRIPYARGDIVIDAAAAGTAIDAQLEALEKTAREKGQAIGIAMPYPVTFEKLKAWIATLDKKGFALAPLTALSSEDMPQPAAAVASPADAEPETSLLPAAKTE